MDVIIVCHAEHGLVRGREVEYHKSAVEGVSGGVRSLASIADRHGAKVTFAVAPEAAGHFPKDVGHEAGLHVHPGQEKHGRGSRAFYVGDDYLRARLRTTSTSSVLPDYPYEEQLAMIGMGKDRIEDVLGVVPKVFVAGRWSVNNDTFMALMREGFTHDCSAVPHKAPAHYDWSRLPRICMPYRPHKDDYQRKGDLPLLVVPVSQSLLGASATPELAPLIGLQWLKACFVEYYRQRMPLFHICLHSPSMTDPYFAGVMEDLLRFIAGHDIAFRFVSEIGEYEDIRPATDIRPYLAGFNRDMLNACPAAARRLVGGAASRMLSAVR